MRWDSTTGQYDMGFRNYSPSLNQFDSRDMYDGALADAGLTTDPFTGSQYAFGGGNPITNIEQDGHTFPGGAQCGILASNPCNPTPASSTGHQPPNCWEGSFCMPQPQLPPGWSFQRDGPRSGVITHTWQQRECSGGARTGMPFCWTQTNQEQFNIGTVCTGGARTGPPQCYPASDFLTPSQGKAVFWAIFGTAISAGLGAAIGGAEELNGGLGELVSVNAKDPAAELLAQRIGGQASVRFANGPDNEFDAVSSDYVAQAKPANFTLNKAFRNQAKATFKVALQSGRTPYFQFDGPLRPGVLEALSRYASQYGIEPVIDLVPLGGS